MLSLQKNIINYSHRYFHTFYCNLSIQAKSLQQSIFKGNVQLNPSHLPTNTTTGLHPSNTALFLGFIPVYKLFVWWDPGNKRKTIFLVFFEMYSLFLALFDFEEPLSIRILEKGGIKNVSRRRNCHLFPAQEGGYWYACQNIRSQIVTSRTWNTLCHYQSAIKTKIYCVSTRLHLGPKPQWCIASPCGKSLNVKLVRLKNISSRQAEQLFKN